MSEAVLAFAARQLRIADDILPDCMMPDGAEPCRGYTAARLAACAPRPITDAMVEAVYKYFGSGTIKMRVSTAGAKAALEAAEEARVKTPDDVLGEAYMRRPNPPYLPG